MIVSEMSRPERSEHSQHVPVLLNETITFLDPHPGDFIIDGTVDGGGHAREILGRITAKGTLLGIDWDEALLAECKARIGGNKNVVLVHGNYADLPEILEKVSRQHGERLAKADGLLVDLGFSSEQLAHSGRGFSFEEAAANEPLLMTYDDSQRPVSVILREESETDLANIIFEFGGERMSRRIAKAIKEQGRRKPIVTSGELVEAVRSAVPRGYEHGRINPATRTFQALRIYANGELENLEILLKNLPAIIKPNGKAAIITFHSLEDRIVKHAFQALAKEKQATIVTKKPVGPSREEIQRNPRSRSAKLRVIQFI
jgi:16S rRNA (cytosine1402-N4)-methyltransferase